MYILDSNVFLESFLPDQLNKQHADEYIYSISENILVPHIVLSEILTLATYRVNKQLANDIRAYIMEDTRFIVLHEDIEEVLILRDHIDVNIAHADVAVIYMALKYNATLISYDKQLMSIYNKIIKSKISHLQS
jgi:predicted nucleic acid-binding protein